MLITLDETVSLIKEGKILHIAADESLLDKLPEGKWKQDQRIHQYDGEGLYHQLSGPAGHWYDR